MSALLMADAFPVQTAVSLGGPAGTAFRPGCGVVPATVPSVVPTTGESSTPSVPFTVSLVVSVAVTVRHDRQGLLGGGPVTSCVVQASGEGGGGIGLPSTAPAVSTLAWPTVSLAVLAVVTRPPWAHRI